MQGLLLKDFLNLKKTLGLLAAMLAIFGVLFVPQGSGIFSGMAIMISMTMAISAMSYDHMAKWDAYALSMPISRRQLAGEKYVFMLLTAGAGALIALIGELIRLASIGAVSEEYLSCMVQVLLVLSVGMLFGSVMLPLIFKFGVEKARLIMLLSFLIPFVIIWGGSFLAKWSAHTGASISWVENLVYLLPLAAVAALGISYALSVKVLQKKEF